MPEVTRREFLQWATTSASAALLAACTGPGSATPVRPSYFPPQHDPIARVDTQWPIKRVGAEG